MTKEDLIKAYESKLEKLKRELKHCIEIEAFIPAHDRVNEIFLVEQFLENLNELK
jgi:non-homologous end joining protein Ku